MKEKKVRNLCVKMYAQPEPETLAVHLMSIGDEVYPPKELEEVTNRASVKNNELPIYAYYSKEDKRWRVSVEAPIGDYTVVTSEYATNYIKEHFDEEFESNEISANMALAVLLKALFL